MSSEGLATGAGGAARRRGFGGCAVPVPFAALPLSGASQLRGRELEVLGVGPERSAVGLSLVWFGGLEGRGARFVDWLELRATPSPSGPGHQQQPFSHPTVGSGTAVGQPSTGAGGRSLIGGLAAEIWASHLFGGELRGTAALRGHLLSGRRVGRGGAHYRAHPQ